jgi:hypothetical protein
MAIGWVITVDITGDGNKASIRGYAVAIVKPNEALSAALDECGERSAEIEDELTQDQFDALQLVPGEVRCIFKGDDTCVCRKLDSAILMVKAAKDRS